LILLHEFHEQLRWAWYDVDLDLHFFLWKNGADTTTIAENQYFLEKLWKAPEFIYGSDVIPDMPKWGWIKKRIYMIRWFYSLYSSMINCSEPWSLWTHTWPQFARSYIKSCMK
jgi:hypothetical protein